MTHSSFVNTYPWKWQAQPYVSWKGTKTTKYAATPKWSRPLTNKDPRVREPGGNAPYAESPYTWNKTRPIKHWRKQLQAKEVRGISRASYSIQSNQPGSNVVSNKQVEPNEGEHCCGSVTASGNNVYHHFNKKGYNDTDNNSLKFRRSGVIFYDNGTKIDLRCESVNNRIRPTAGMNTVPINPTFCKEDNNFVDCNSRLYTCITPTKKFNFNTAQYLASKNKTYEQNLTGRMIDGVKYTYKNDNCCTLPAPYRNTPTYGKNPQDLGPQVRTSFYGSEYCGTNDKCINIVVKPNNTQYFQQGAVSSSSRIDRLKYNTIQANIKSIGKTWGKPAGNAVSYTGNYTAAYINKSKNNKCYESQYAMRGNKRICD